MRSLILFYAALFTVAGYATACGSFIVGSGAAFVAVLVGCVLTDRLRSRRIVR